MARVKAFALAAALACALAAMPGARAAADPSEAGRASGPIVMAPLTSAEVRSLLDALAEAHAREDVAGLVALHDQPLRKRMESGAKRLFKDRNYLRLETRVLGMTAEADRLDVEVVQVLRSRRVSESADRREKARWVYALARRPDGVRIVSSHAAPPAPLPQQSPWRPESFTGRIVLRPAAARAEGDADVSLDLRIRNDSLSEQSSVAFVLHPFVTALDARRGEQLLAAERTEGSLDAWVIPLEQAIGPGQEVTLSLAYRIAEVGLGPDSSIGPDGARFTASSCWLPVVRPSHRDDAVRATHDLVVETPPGLSAALPGRLESVEDLPEGRRAWRWRSQLPGADIALLAGRWTHQVVRATDRVSFDVFRASEAPPRVPQSADPGLIARAISMVRYLESFAPPRVERFTLVEGAAPNPVSGPQLMGLPDFEASWNRAQEKETQGFYFVAHYLAHGWVVDGAAPTGSGSGYVTEGLCDHLASAWTGEEVDPILPRLYRGSILGGIGGADSADRPLIGAHDEVPFPEVFGVGKAFLAFDGYRRLAGDEAWRSRLGAWLAGPPGRDISALLPVLSGDDPVLAAYLRAFFERQGFAEARLLDVRLRDLTEGEAREGGLDPDVWHRCEVRLRNVGLGPAPARVVAEINGVMETRDVVLGDEEQVVGFNAMGLPRSVRLDPERILWTTTSNDDVWPIQPPKPREEFGHVKSLTQPDDDGGDLNPWRDRLPPPRHR